MQTKTLWAIMLAFGILVGLTAINTGNKTSASFDKAVMDRLVHAAEKEQGSLIEWSLHTRELLGENEQRWTLSKLRQQFPEWRWKEDVKDGETQLLGVYEQPRFTEKVMVTGGKGNSRPSSYISYEIKGDIWNDTISRKAGHLMNERSEIIFKRETTVFSCIKGVFNDNGTRKPTEKKLIVNLLTTLQSEEREALKEDGFYSVSAYSSLLSHYISLQDEKMNLQIGLRETEDQTGFNFTIGTPILVNEY